MRLAAPFFSQFLCASQASPIIPGASFLLTFPTGPLRGRECAERRDYRYGREDQRGGRGAKDGAREAIAVTMRRVTRAPWHFPASRRMRIVD